jgi:hypothetical protein
MRRGLQISEPSFNFDFFFDLAGNLFSPKIPLLLDESGQRTADALPNGLGYGILKPYLH